MAEGVQFIPLVAPQVPIADNTAAKIIAGTDLAGSFTRGLAAFGQINAQRQRQELELKQLAQETNLKEQAFGLAKEKQDHDFEIKKELLPLQRDLMRAHTDSYLATGKAKVATQVNVLDYQKKIASAVTDFQGELKKRNLLDPNPKSPMQAYSDYTDLASVFENVRIPAVQGVLGNLRKRFDGMTIPLPHYGASPDPDDAAGKMTGGEKRSFSPGQIIAQLQEPSTAGIMTNALQDAGVIVPETTTLAQTEKDTPWYKRLGLGGSSGEKKAVVGYKTPDWLKSWVEGSKGISMKPHSEPRPAIGMMSKWMAAGIGGGATSTRAGQLRDQGAIDQASQRLGQEDSIPADGAIEPTALPGADEDVLLQQARRAAAMPNADMDGIRGYLQLNNIDPGQL